MPSPSDEHWKFIQELWEQVRGAQIKNNSNTIEIVAPDFNRLGEEGERFFKQELSMIVNGIVEFYTDSTDNNRMHLASPMAVVQGMNFEISSVPGEQLRTLTPFNDTPVDQQHAPLNHGTQFEQANPPQFMRPLEFTPPIMQHPEMNNYVVQLSGCQTHAGDLGQTQQWSNTVNYGQGMPNMVNYGQYMPPTLTTGSSGVAYPMPYQTFPYPLTPPAESCAGPQQPIAPASRKRKSSESDSPQEAADNETSPSEDSEHIPRPRNAFFIFRSYMYHKLREENPSLSGGNVSTLCGVIWKGMSDKERQPWNDQAEIEAAEHKRKYPNWTYKPGQKKARLQKAKEREAAKGRAS